MSPSSGPLLANQEARNAVICNWGNRL